MTGSSVRSPCDVGIVIQPRLQPLLRMGGEPAMRASWVWSGMVGPDWGRVSNSVGNKRAVVILCEQR